VSNDDAIALVALALLWGGRGGTMSGLEEDLGPGWVLPMPELSAARASRYGLHRRPVVTDGMGPNKRRDQNGNPRWHLGVDMFYERTDPWPKDDAPPPGETRRFAVPPGTDIVAANNGRIWSAGRGSTGWYCIIDHGPDLPYATYYTHMSSLAIPSVPGRVRIGPRRNTVMIAAGQVLGTCGASPLDSAGLVHLHFEVRKGMVRLNPERQMRRWKTVIQS
jgi:murein DD-endopeptidase MepM/ murein hydrolase activator NlpD